jgi:hypothetical protein
LKETFMVSGALREPLLHAAVRAAVAMRAAVRNGGGVGLEEVVGFACLDVEDEGAEGFAGVGEGVVFLMRSRESLGLSVWVCHHSMWAWYLASWASE